jgi:YggT family protein
MPILVTLANFIQIYSLLVVIRILLSWFNVDWYRQPFTTLAQITDPYLNVFRGLIPMVGGMDFSPMLACLLLGILQSALVSVAL